MKWSKVVSADTLESYDAWDVPEVQDGEDDQIEAPTGVMTAEEIEAIQKQAYEEAFKEGLAAGNKEGYEAGQKDGFSYGHKEGLTQGQAKIEEIYQVFSGIITLLEAPLKTMDQYVEDELVQLVLAISTQVILIEVKTQPDLILQVIRQALPLLPISARQVSIKVNPQDAELIKQGEALLQLAGRELEIDETIHPGGCDILSESSRIDATLESRLKEAIAIVLNCDTDNLENPLAPA